MSTPITPAPFTGRGYISPGAIQFSAVDNGDHVTLSWTNSPLVAGWATVGKEYPNAPLDVDAREYAGQMVSCVPSPDGQALYLPACFTQTWDSVIAFKSDPAGVVTMDVPYNQFMLAGNGCAFQTDGLAHEYYMELVTSNGSSRTKFIFSFIAPSAPWAYPGEPPAPPSTPPPASTAPTQPGKGNSGNSGKGNSGK
jgi:hypothetical protein